jgi:hypothetical protein
VCVAAVAVLRAGSLARRLDGSGVAVVCPPQADVASLLGLPIGSLDTRALLLLTTCAAAGTAFAWDRLEHATAGGALATAGVEALAVLACFLVLGPALGLRHRRARA